MRPSIPSKFRALLHPQIPLTCGPHILTFSTQQVHLPSRFLIPYVRYHTPTVYIIPPTSLHQPVPQNHANRIKQTLALTPPVSSPREPRPEGEPCMYTFICEIFVCSRTYFFVRALLAKTLNLRRHRKAVRNLLSRFELDPRTVAGEAGAQSFSFFMGG